MGVKEEEGRGLYVKEGIIRGRKWIKLNNLIYISFLKDLQGSLINEKDG